MALCVVSKIDTRSDSRMHSMANRTPSKVRLTKCIINDDGSVSLVPGSSEIGVEIVVTSDHALKLKHVLDRLVIVGDGHIDRETS
ncbi:hypothetical protein VNO77_23041 [Canavalia gladiata]|uniref:Uncharacterized protein n=1 Tax=Canavalia gladiata TaxID=3824 RepID=A0AAN9L4N0_CANGL